MPYHYADIHTSAHMAAENELYAHFRMEQAPFMYDSNFLLFKTIPPLDEFLKAMEYLKAFHLQHNQFFVKFIWPEDAEFPSAVLDYLGREDYSLEILELYSLRPDRFQPTRPLFSADIRAEIVTAATRQDYLDLNYRIDLQFGELFARQKRNMVEELLQLPHFIPVLAYHNNEPAGSLDLWAGAGTLEIDNFHVLENLRGKGIGTALQQCVMDYAGDRTILLVADASDSARTMYQRQNYHYETFWYTGLKIF